MLRRVSQLTLLSTLILKKTMTTITVFDTKVPIKAAHADIDPQAVLQFQPFKDWLSGLSQEQERRQGELRLKEIELQSVDKFQSGKIGFVKFKVDAELKETGKSLPGIIFMRGGSVSILIILRTENKDFTIVCVQPRLAVPTLEMSEIPAGMLDGSGKFAGKAAEEIKEETGLEIKEDELIDLTELAYKETSYRGIYTTAGASDEFLRLFVCVKPIKEAEVHKLEGKLTGLRDHGEAIKLRIMPLDELWKIPDVKALSTLALMESLKKAGKIKL
ncbi:uncharacterized protein VTP21DRAFT_10541 [Calcarisporiella thermophila]|uniref:uncharacterized protein n=1 Tax=Calcarisporiella thermophila TaxID=911321 RepID=UPI0037423B49